MLYNKIIISYNTPAYPTFILTCIFTYILKPVYKEKESNKIGHYKQVVVIYKFNYNRIIYNSEKITSSGLYIQVLY